MPNPDFTVIPCRVCKGATVVKQGSRKPIICARCRAPFDPATGSFGRAPDDAGTPGRESESASEGWPRRVTTS
jgi:hypothetical protein